MKLIIRVGNTQDIIQEFMEKFNVKGIYSHEEPGNEWTFKRDKDLRHLTKSESIQRLISLRDIKKSQITPQMY